MSVVQMKLARRHGDTIDVFQGPLFSRLRAELPANPQQRSLWASHIEFNDAFYEGLKKHAVPLDKAALGALKHSARALDIYTWLSSRLWRVHPSRPVKLRWTTLRQQFASPDVKMSSFKRQFQKALQQVLFVYPRADVASVYGGLELRHSPPPVPFKNTKLLK